MCSEAPDGAAHPCARHPASAGSSSPRHSPRSSPCPPAPRRPRSTSPALNGSFAGGTGGWTSTSSCAPLCTVTNAFDPAPARAARARRPSSTRRSPGLLGGLASGTSTWTSPSFTWTSPQPASATPLARAQGRDRRPARRSEAPRARACSCATSPPGRPRRSRARRSRPPTRRSPTHSLAIDSVAARAGALLPRAADDEPRRRRAAQRHPRLLRRRRASPATSSTAGGTGTPAPAAPAAGTGGATGTRLRLGTPPAGPAAGTRPLRLAAPREVRFTPGRRGDVRVRATRAGKPVARLVVTLRFGARDAARHDGPRRLRLAHAHAPRPRAAAHHVPRGRGDRDDLGEGARVSARDDAFDNGLPFRRRVLLGAFVAGLALV